MNWVDEGKTESRKSGFVAGYCRGIEDVRTLLDAENLATLSAWLESSIDESFRRVPRRPDDSEKLIKWDRSCSEESYERHVLREDRPRFTPQMGDLSQSEQSALSNNTNRLGRCAPALIEALDMLHCILDGGLVAFRKKYPSGLTVETALNMAAAALSHAREP